MGNPAIDLIIRIKNGYLAKKETINLSYTRFGEDVVKKLKGLHFIKDYRITGSDIKAIEVDLMYDKGEPAINDVAIYSKPGRRYYVSYRHLKPVLSGFGVSIISTSKGILTNKEARQAKLGGELLFNLW